MLTGPTSVAAVHRFNRSLHLGLDEACRVAQLRDPIPENMRNNSDNSHLPHDLDGMAEDLSRTRPDALPEVDQCHLKAASLARRVLRIRESRPVSVSRIAFVGDDDLASLLLLQTSVPFHLALFDLDERILNAVARYANNISCAATIMRIDFSSEDQCSDLLQEHGGSYDVVVTDPPYATGGMMRFVDVATGLCSYTGEVHIAVPTLYGEAWSDELMYMVQERLIERGYVLDRVIPGEFTYETSSVVSSNVVARRLPGGPAISTTVDPTSKDRFYTTRVRPAASPLLTAKLGEERK